jgi:hypothetical protein
MTDARQDGLRVAYLFPYAPGAHDAKTYGFTELAERGVSVEVLDLSALVMRGRPETTSTGAGVPAARVRDMRDLDERLAHMSGVVFVDYVAGLSEPSPEAERVLRALGTHGLPYVIVSAAALPPPVPPRDARERFRKLAVRMRQALDPRSLARFVSRRARRLVSGPRPLQLPARVFSGHSPALEAYMARMQLPTDRVVWINSFDYDEYVRFLRERAGEPVRPERIAVFVDEAASSHPDFAFLGTEWMAPTDAVYSASMRRLFDLVEERTGLRVVVAAHPRSDYASRPGFFGDREVVCGRTIELIAESSLVIAHGSTALSYAALLEKPTLLTVTAEMQRTPYAPQVIRIARGLGLEVVDVDDRRDLEAVSWDYERWPREGFAEYVRRYVRSPEAPVDLTTWEIVERGMRELSAE